MELPKKTSAAFDEWMRRYIDEPERFQREFQAVQDFISSGSGRSGPSTYGENCAHYLGQILAEING
jgi:hypothetical protein